MEKVIKALVVQRAWLRVRSEESKDPKTLRRIDTEISVINKAIAKLNQK